MHFNFPILIMYFQYSITFWSDGYMSRGYFAWGVIVQWVYVRGYLSREYMSGGICPGSICPRTVPNMYWMCTQYVLDVYSLCTVSSNGNGCVIPCSLFHGVIRTRSGSCNTRSKLHTIATTTTIANKSAMVGVDGYEKIRRN